MSRTLSLVVGTFAFAGVVVTSCGEAPTSADRENTPESPSAVLVDTELEVLQRTEPLEEAAVVSEWVDESGGTLAAADMELRVPEGAVDEPVHVTMRVPAGEDVQAKFEPSGLTFDVPATLAIDLADTEAASESELLDALVGAYFVNAITDGLVDALETELVTVSDGRAYFQIDHFSGYCLARGRKKN